MNVILENLTDKPLWAQLNSGVSLHIGPRSQSSSVPDNEVNGNPRLVRLAKEHVIRVLESARGSEDAAKKPKESGTARDTDKTRK